MSRYIISKANVIRFIYSIVLILCCSPSFGYQDYDIREIDGKYYEFEYYSFETSMGSGWNEKIFGHPWVLDTNVYDKTQRSIRSTYLGKMTSTTGLGASSISRDVTGPADISFWWMYEAEPCGGMLYFLVDGKRTSNVCRESWTSVIYSVPINKTETIEWRFEVTDSQRLDKGVGWVDELYINYTTPIEVNETISEPHVVNETISEPHVVNETISEPHVVNETISEPHVVNETISEPHVVNETFGEIPYFNDTTYADNLNYTNLAYTYRSINEAIEHVEIGGTVIVSPGEYTEQISIYKSLNISSLDNMNTYVGNQNGGNVISVYSNDISIDGFIIGGADSGVYIINASNCILRRNKIHNCETGIKISYGSNIEINNNYISGCEYGASIYGINCDITNNSISNSKIGVIMRTSDSNFISNNISVCEVGISIIVTNLTFKT